MTFVFGRRMGDADEASLGPLAKQLASPQGHLGELLVAIARSDAFRFRPPLVVEACR
jgi:hypothetical protein